MVRKLGLALTLAALGFAITASIAARAQPSRSLQNEIEQGVWSGRNNQQNPTPPPNFGYTPTPPKAKPDMFGTWVIDEKDRMFYATAYYSIDESEAVAMRSCQSAGGKRCKRVQRWGNQCIAFAQAPGDITLYSGFDDHMASAEKAAWEKCNGKHPGQCKLITLAVCAGTDWDARSVERKKNQDGPEWLEAATRNAENKPPQRK